MNKRTILLLSTIWMTNPIFGMELGFQVIDSTPSLMLSPKTSEAAVTLTRENRLVKIQEYKNIKVMTNPLEQKNSYLNAIQFLEETVELGTATSDIYYDLVDYCKCYVDISKHLMKSKMSTSMSMLRGEYSMVLGFDSGIISQRYLEKSLNYCEEYFKCAPLNTKKTFDLILYYSSSAGFSLNSFEKNLEYAQKGLHLLENYIELQGSNLNANKWEDIGSIYARLARMLLPEAADDYLEKAALYYEQALSKKNPLDVEEYTVTLGLLTKACNEFLYWGQNEEKKKNFVEKAVSFAKRLPENYRALLLDVYQNAAKVETTVKKKKLYQDAAKRISSEYGIHVCRLGDKTFTLTNDELREWENINRDQIEETLEKDQPTKKKPPRNRKKKKTKVNVEQKLDLTPNLTLDAFDETSEKSIEKSIEVEEIESDTIAKNNDDLDGGDQKAGDVEPQETREMETKSQEVRLPTPVYLNEGRVVFKRKYMNVQKSYQPHEEQARVRSVLQDILDLKDLHTVKEDVVIRYLNRIMFLLGGKERTSREGPLLTILDERFGYAPAHGSKNGDWSHGRIRSFVDFATRLMAKLDIILENNSEAR